MPACEADQDGPVDAPLGDGEIPGSSQGDGGGDASPGAGAGDEGAGEGGGDDGAGAEGGADDGDGGSSSGGGNGSVEPGTLTAGVWDDNLNFERFSSYRSEFVSTQPEGLPPFTQADHEDAHAAYANRPRQHLDIALVFDTTGSMGDELTYLQAEFDALSATIAASYPDAEQRWSLVVYRDETDEYVVRWFDFRDDPGELRSKLAEQSAGGGGDYPEAPDRALEITNQLTWRADDDTAKLVFWVADAPHHGQNAQAFADAVRIAAEQDVHIYPVASSGVDEFTEFSMRAAAQLTGGRYIFLTDDSGVGGSHLEPSIPCYFVTKLDDAILRMVDIELSGTYREPAAEDVLRVGGDPQDGVCALSDGETVQVF